MRQKLGPGSPPLTGGSAFEMVQKRDNAIAYVATARHELRSVKIIAVPYLQLATPLSEVGKQVVQF